jgi:hypothetical protein
MKKYSALWKHSKDASFFFAVFLYCSGFDEMLTKMIQNIFGSDAQLLIFATRFEIKLFEMC